MKVEFYGGPFDGTVIDVAFPNRVLMFSLVSRDAENTIENHVYQGFLPHSPCKQPGLVRFAYHGCVTRTPSD